MAAMSGRSFLSTTLLQKMLDGSAEGWNRFVLIYAPIVGNWCRRYELQAADVNDVIQDVFLRLARSLSTYDSGRPFLPWLATITRNALLTHVTKRDPVAGEGGSDALRRLEEFPATADDDSSLVVTDDDLRLVVSRTLALIEPEFSSTTWQAFWRRTVDDVPGVLVAAELGLSENAVRIAVHRVRRRIHDLLGDLPGDTAISGD